MKVVFRVDASRAIGTGHVMRCLALADAVMAAEGTCQFVMRSLAGNLGELVKARGHTVTMLPAPACNRPPASAGDSHRAWLEADPDDDAAETAAALADNGIADWLVVDHYALDARWESAVRPCARRIAVIDDLADRSHECDLLIDQNLQDRESRYDQLVLAGCERLLGPRYALLRPEFAARRANLVRDPAAPVRRVLVFLGGVDAPGATMPAIAALERIRTNDMIADVVVGRNNPRANEIAVWCKSRPWINVHGGDSDLLALMAIADMAIGAGGTTVWERCAQGLPSVLIAIADNQRPGSEAIARRGAALYAGLIDDGLTTRLEAMIATLLTSGELRAHLAENAATLVDGHGVTRVLARLSATVPIIRPAVAADSDAIFAWRNAEETRRHFRDPRPLVLGDHERWFERTMASNDCDLLVAEADGDPIGVLRFDLREKEAEVSVYLVPGRTGRGEGPRVLRAGLDWLARMRPSVSVVEAEVLAANEASHRAFLAAGFKPFSTTYRYAMTGRKA